MTPFWGVILTALILGAAVHGRRYAEARKLRKRQAELLRMFAPPGRSHQD